MILFINDKPRTFDADTLTVAELVELLNIGANGTAVAVNGRLATHCAWPETEVKDGDRLTIISAAYGG
ncbi:MAG: sulfur carrier protein ThiS [Lepagella sp.]